MSDTHHFKERVNGGVLLNNPTVFGSNIGGGVWVMQLTDFPIFQKFNSCFEMVRLNSVTIEYLPKANMQLNYVGLTAGGSPTSNNISISGTLITAMDQVPYNVVIGTTATSTNWINDVSNTSGTTSAAPYSNGVITPGYVRGLQNAKERELYKKQSQTFNPAFYTPILGGDGQTTFTPVAWQRNVKKWVSTNIQSTIGDQLVTSGNGPLYYGPIFALDVNGNDDSLPNQLFDIRLTYNMSFRRLKGV